MLEMLHDFALIFLPLFVVVDPAGTVPVYLALTSRQTDVQRRKIALRATTVAGVTAAVLVPA